MDHKTFETTRSTRVIRLRGTDEIMADGELEDE